MGHFGVIVSTITNHSGTIGIDRTGPTNSHHVRELMGSAQEEGLVGGEESSSFHLKVCQKRDFCVR